MGDGEDGWVRERREEERKVQEATKVRAYVSMDERKRGCGFLGAAVVIRTVVVRR